MSNKSLPKNGIQKTDQACMMDQKVALVSGASRGIGRAIALLLAREGADVAVNYNSDDKAAEEVVKLIEGLGRRAIAIKGNVSRYEDVIKIIEKVKAEFGKIDLLVNNAGITRDRVVKNMTPDEWTSVIDTNLSGAAMLTKHALEIFSEGGSIVSISSVVGLSGNAGQANYAAAKAGIIGFTKSLAKEVARKNIRVNAIAPGFIVTEMTNEIPYFRRMMVKMIIPLRRFGTCDDVAEAAVFLLSDDASYITGQVVKVDGGMMF